MARFIAQTPADHLNDSKRTEESDAFLAAIVNSTDDAIVSKTLEGVVTSWNRGAELLFGYSADEMVGQPILKLIPEDRVDEEYRILSAIRRGERVEHYETVRRRKNGEYVDVSLTISPVIDSQGKIIGASKIARNIGRLKQAVIDAKLAAEANAKFRTFFDQGSYFALVLTVEGTVIEVNRFCLGHYGCKRSEVLGKKLWDCPWWAKSLELKARLEKATHQTASGTSFREELPYRSENGTDKIIDLVLAPIREEKGNVLFLAMTGLDVTEQRRSEQLLRQNQALLEREATTLARLNEWNSQLWRQRSLSDGLNEMLDATIELLQADKGNIQLLDDSNVLRIRAQRGFDDDFLNFFREVNLDDDSACGRALRSRQRILIEDVETDSDYATLREVARRAGYRAVQSTPLISREGHVLGMVSTHWTFPFRPSQQDLRRLDLYARQAVDFIERIKIEQSLQASEAGLRALSSQLEALVEERTTELAKSRDHLRALTTELHLAEQRERKQLAAELHDHLQQLLALCKINLGHGKRFAEAVPACKELIRTADELLSTALQYTRNLVAELNPPVLREHGLAAGLKWLANYMQKYGMHVTLTQPEHEFILSDDQSILLFQSVRELLMNSYKHSGSEAASVVMDWLPDALVIEVRDRGKGFELSELKEGDPTKPKFGLFSIRERMNALKGTLVIESSPGRGTTARLKLPLGSIRLPHLPQGNSRCLT